MPDKLNSHTGTPPKWLIIFSLILAGEMIFSLPFHVPRFFRPTLLEVFQIDNAAFGDAFVLYGIMAMLSYFPGGMIADRVSPRKLITLSLLATGLGGIFFAMIPGPFMMAVIFGYWGITTVLLLWAAMIRATREWGGKMAQGRAFGLLDGGRGLVSAGAASLAVIVLAAFLPDDLAVVTSGERRQALQSVIYFYSTLTIAVALLTWFFIPDSSMQVSERRKSLFAGIRYVVRKRAVWLQAAIVICAYCAYKGLDFYTLYGVDILGMNEVDAAKYMSMATYLRPVSAIGCGFLADRFSSRGVIGVTFAILTVSYILLALSIPESFMITIIVGNLVFTFIAAYALRGVYFALLEETSIAGSHTGAAVGLISVIGFTPDVFFYSAGGRIIDAAPGLSGFHHYFWFLMAFALAGVLASLWLNREVKTTPKDVAE